MKNVALCISGQFREFQQCVTWINEFVDSMNNNDYSVNVFLSTWEEQGISTNIGRMLPDEFSKYLPISLARDNKHENKLEESLPGLTLDIKNSIDDRKINDELLIEEIKNLRSVKTNSYRKFKIDNKETFDISKEKCSSTNLLPMFYLIKESYNLCSSYELKKNIKHDLYIRMRPDQKIDLNKIDVDLRRLEISNAIYGLYHPAYKENSFFSDQFYIGNKNNFHTLCCVWDNILHYIRNDKINKSPEMITYYHLNTKNIRSERIHHRPYPEFSGYKMNSNDFFERLLKLIQKKHISNEITYSTDFFLYCTLLKKPEMACYFFTKIPPDKIKELKFSLLESLIHRRNNQRELELKSLSNFILNTRSNSVNLYVRKFQILKEIDYEVAELYLSSIKNKFKENKIIKNLK